eukprot:GHRQ01022771.1.p1 GENE.GHRQ01022771.1~~GHRQ01022771.1.p1  ORF type:complete len:107 (-),score=16.56 GHRQ01022771.1:367-687(-)
MARSDVQYVVRNTALHIWKTIVVNTPKTLQEILPALMAEVISALADPGGWPCALHVCVTWYGCGRKEHVNLTTVVVPSCGVKLPAPLARRVLLSVVRTANDKKCPL